MKSKPRLLLFALMQFLAAGELYAQPTFAGALITGTNSGFTAGKISLTFSNSEAFFQATMFSNWVSAAPLQAILKAHQKDTIFGLGAGTPGRWPMQEFIGPAPGTQPQAPANNPSNLERFPSPPVFFDGVRFTGSIAASPDLEHLLRSRDGTIRIQIYGTVSTGDSLLQDPLVTATLMEVTKQKKPRDENPSPHP